MTQVGSGGVVIRQVEPTRTFARDRKKLTDALRHLLDDKLRDLLCNPMPRGLRFEKLKGYKKPDVYTFHLTGNYKVSLSIEGDVATLRRVACYNQIDRQP